MSTDKYVEEFSERYKCNLPIERICTRNNCGLCPYGERRNP